MTTVEPSQLTQNTAHLHTTPLCTEEKERIILFEKCWQAPFNLRPHQKEAVKRYWSIKQGRDGTRALCFFCNIEFGISQLQIHHIDHDRRNNQLPNIPPACESCNNDERRVWLAERMRHHGAAHHIGTQLNKEKDSDMQRDQADKLLQAELLKQAPTTFQKSVDYKRQALKYLVQHVKEPRSFDQAVADIEAITGCSHNKAIEYLNGFSMSSFAGWRQWFSGENGQWIAPRPGEAYDKAVKSIERAE